MPVDKSLIDDLMKVGENALGTLFGARHEAASQARAIQERIVEKMELVSRREFDAAFAMLAKLRDEQEAILERLDALEAKLAQSSGARATKNKKSALRSVNQGNQKLQAKRKR
jgi:BMFP domain-containing protein YqiC